MVKGEGGNGQRPWIYLTPSPGAYCSYLGFGLDWLVNHEN